MESLAGFVVAAALVLRFAGKERLSSILFGVGAVFVAVLLVLHATAKLPLNF